MRVLIRFHGSTIAETDLRPDREYIIGRAAESDIRLTQGFISRRHARIYFSDGKWWYQDLREGHENYKKEPIEITDEEKIDLEGGAEIFTESFLASHKTMSFDASNKERKYVRRFTYKMVGTLAIAVFVVIVLVVGYFYFFRAPSEMDANKLFDKARPSIVEFELLRLEY